MRMALGAQPGDVLGMIVEAGAVARPGRRRARRGSPMPLAARSKRCSPAWSHHDGMTLGVAIALAVVMAVAGTLVPYAARVASESDYCPSRGLTDARAKARAYVRMREHVFLR